jgi:O-antigen/teichoic acid export membrane protein
MKLFIQKLIGFSIGPVIGAFISFITVPLTTYFIDPAEFGKASMFMLFQMILSTFLFLGIDQAYTREYHSVTNKLELFQNSIVLPMLASFVVFVVTALFPHQVSSLLFGSPKYVTASILFGLMIIFMVVERYVLLSIRMRESALEYSILNIFVKLAILIVTLLFVIFIRRDFLAVVYSTVFGQIVGDLYLLARYRKLFAFHHFSLDKVLLKRMLKFGLPLVIATSLASLLNSMDRLSLRAWSTFYQIGIFTATLKIAAVVTIVQTSFTNFWVPTAYRWHSEGKNINYFKIVSDSILLIMSILSIGILIFKDLIIGILSSGYSDAKYLIGFLCLQPIIYSVSETTCLGIVFSRKSYLNIWVSIVAFIPNVVLNVLLVPKYGAVGAAIATAVSYVFFFAGRTYFSSKNGMNFSVFKHITVFLILLAASFMNTSNFKEVSILNVVLLFILMAVQYSTFIKISEIYHKEKQNKKKNTV